MNKQIARFAPVAIVLLTGSASYGQDKTTEIDKIFSWAKTGTPGCACAISQNGKLVVNRAYGSADLERDVPISSNSIFDAGSLTKQFVAAATLMLVEEGKLSLTEDIRKYIPELPDYGQKITPDHLLTHTSGLRDWTGLLPFSANKPDALTMVLRQRNTNFAPGEEWAYSNSGYVLLKEIIARTTGKPFGEFAAKRLFEPLGMASTSYRDDLRDIIKQRALAYEQEQGRWKMTMLLDNDRGGGGALLTTATDLLIWNEALNQVKLGRFVTDKLQEPARLNNGRQLDYARGLMLDTYRGSKEIWHSGSAAGYKGWLGRYPEQGLSIAILCNSGDGTNRINFAHRIFDLFVPATNTPGEQSAKAPASATDTNLVKVAVTSFAGIYFNESNGEALRLVADGNKLRIGGGALLETVSTNHFRWTQPVLQFMSQSIFDIQVTSNDQFELTTKEGKVTRYRRAKDYTPTAEELKAFAGRYESDEIGTVFELIAGDRGLEVRMEHAPTKRVPLRPVDFETFNTSQMFFRFIRDKAGKVVAFDYTNPVARHVAFKKLSEKPAALVRKR
ncbi:serine hydrolase domain-containing protein [Paraflavitalea sp. CAU 1676]|uniref:serine hydrolase domain-containing protein n=1 Tax=Paraflavitalea sp. CAU 1676 TaxID=3032598 RepID=UPI0023D9B555|nr:serine hydrolase domain-containing protein [Paraflavitalea sp. CAU 1676]MDF2193747.1 serine hydrolase [Paraflavitalea sp. CAU 1676]